MKSLFESIMKSLQEYLIEAYFKPTYDPEYWEKHWAYIDEEYARIHQDMLRWANDHKYAVIEREEGGTLHPLVVFGNPDKEICVGVELNRASGWTCYVWKNKIYSNCLDLADEIGVEDIPEIPPSWRATLKKFCRTQSQKEALDWVEKRALAFVAKINKKTL